MEENCGQMNDNKTNELWLKLRNLKLSKKGLIETKP